MSQHCLSIAFESLEAIIKSGEHLFLMVKKLEPVENGQPYGTVDSTNLDTASIV